MKNKKEDFALNSFDRYAEKVETFHGFAAPGVLIGWFMVKKARPQLQPGVLYKALCETPKCLPDAIQLLTPCTIDNGRLAVLPLGRFALTLFDKNTGGGEPGEPESDQT